jgi:hypothetical protein
MRSKRSFQLLALGCLVGAGITGAAQAQLAATNNAVTVRSNQNLVGAAAGTGTQQGASVVDVQPANGRPAVGVGVGSGKVDHFGSKASVSVANNARILGVDGAGGTRSPNSVSVRNPTQQPVLNSAPTAATGNLPH